MSDSPETLAVYLYRATDAEGTTYYGSMRQVGTRHPVELIGVATRQRMATISGADDRTTFERRVETVADAVRWFDEPVQT